MKQRYLAELTDTFGGEANYSWVKRFTVTAKSPLGAIQKLSKEIGLSFHCVDKYSDTLRYDSHSACTCLFLREFDADIDSHYHGVKDL